MKSERRKFGKVLIFAVFFATFVFMGVGCASAGAIYVPDNYTSIQQAVNGAGTGDTIIVRDDIYTENVNVNVDNLTIRSENGSASTIVRAANPDDHVFEVTADYVNISGFTVQNATGWDKSGIYLNGVAHCNISNNNVSNNWHGIKLDLSTNNTIRNNNACSNHNHGMRLEESSYNIISNNYASFNQFKDGIKLNNSNHNHIFNNTLYSNRIGINMEYSRYNNVTNNTLLSNNNHGIWMENSNNNTISNNIASSSTTYNGILMRNCSYNTLENNTANSNNQHGIHLRSSNYNNLTSNRANSNEINGIVLYSSTRNILINNSASNNEIGFAVPPTDPINKSYFDNTVDPSNRVNGKPFYYYFNQSDQVIEGLDAGHIAIPFCTNFTVRNVTVTDADGIFLRGSLNNTVTDCISVNNTFGMMIDSSDGNNISNNNLSHNFVGIEMGKSQWNTVSNNTLDANDARGTNFNDMRNLEEGSGIIMSGASHNQLFNNTASSNNGFGIVLRTYSQNNTILGNNASSNGDTGIKLDYSSYNNLTNNTASENGQHGIWLRRSPYNTLRANAMDKNGLINLILKESPSLEWWNNDIDTSNTVNGLPVYYIYNQSDLIIDNYVTKKLSVVGCENVTVKNINYSDGDPITFTFTNNSLIENCTITNNNAGSFLLIWSHYNNLTNNSALNNEKGGFSLQADSSHNNITNNIITGNGEWGIRLNQPTSNNRIYNNYFDTPINAYDEGNNIWNITSSTGQNIVEGPYLGGNYWSDYSGEDLDGDGLGDTLLPYDSSGGIVNGGDWLPLVKPMASIFDTGKGTYPSIMGTHNGTITPSSNISVSRLYTYPCPGTGGHTESIELYDNDTLIANGTWRGYKGDWHNLTINNVTDGAPYVTLLKDHEYRYVIETGSYPQIIHAESKDVTGGTITCTEFRDANGRTYNNWIPAIRLS